MGVLAGAKSPLLLRSLRVVQAILAIIVLGLAAYVVNWWSNHWHVSSPHSFRFLVFCAVWTLLALIYLIVAQLRLTGAKVHNLAAVAIDAITMIFWFAGFIATAVFISDRSCFGSVCHAAKAAAVFGAFAWVTFAITTALTTLGLRSGSNAGTRETGTNLSAQTHV